MIVAMNGDSREIICLAIFIPYPLIHTMPGDLHLLATEYGPIIERASGDLLLLQTILFMTWILTCFPAVTTVDLLLLLTNLTHVLIHHQCLPIMARILTFADPLLLLRLLPLLLLLGHTLLLLLILILDRILLLLIDGPPPHVVTSAIFLMTTTATVTATTTMIQTCETTIVIVIPTVVETTANRILVVIKINLVQMSGTMILKPTTYTEPDDQFFNQQKKKPLHLMIVLATADLLSSEHLSASFIFFFLFLSFRIAVCNSCNSVFFGLSFRVKPLSPPPSLGISIHTTHLSLTFLLQVSVPLFNIFSREMLFPFSRGLILH